MQDNPTQPFVATNAQGVATNAQGGSGRKRPNSLVAPRIQPTSAGFGFEMTFIGQSTVNEVETTLPDKAITVSKKDIAKRFGLEAVFILVLVLLP